MLAEALAEAKKDQTDPAEQIRAMGRAYWDFAFANKEYYQLMFGLGIPTCDTAVKIPALATFSEVITSSLIAMVEPGKQPSFNPWLKYQSFWSMLHGLVSINMNRLGGSPDKTGDQEKTNDHAYLPLQVLGDVICSFIRGIQAQEGESGHAA